MPKDPMKQFHALQLTPRDMEIFETLQTFGPKSSAEISKTFWNENSRRAKAAFQRIRKLIESGFLERPDPKLLYLTDRGKAALTRKNSTQSVEEAKPNA